MLCRKRLEEVPVDWYLTKTAVDLSRWEKRPFSAGVEQGPRPGDKRDNHERVVGFEEPGAPQPAAYAARLAEAILRFDVFPPTLADGVLRRQPVEVGGAKHRH